MPKNTQMNVMKCSGILTKKNHEEGSTCCLPRCQTRKFQVQKKHSPATSFQVCHNCVKVLTRGRALNVLSDSGVRVVLVEVEALGRTSEVTKCPSCEEVVVTETHSTRGGAVWIMCFMCTFMGCVAGCCLIPFFMKRLRNTHHHCPQCQAIIHTHHPL
ncbi:cell death-inducing p53-target protein 1 [Austrofundulus limnaeus]|uniref:Cell death-inducing p53-target protein 1 n=1 Tax=Austrofundulus limnaeus TaxID=52670 RepID=A0A2I4CUX2_AUSLI|nr:PREDICTED: lipopolysaccharide-induced tumor necrosis factor-alpha factor [Austrofundulus limnaeus]